MKLGMKRITKEIVGNNKKLEWTWCAETWKLNWVWLITWLSIECEQVKVYMKSFTVKNELWGGEIVEKVGLLAAIPAEELEM